MEANITPDILWMSRGYYHILLFYTFEAASSVISAAKLRPIPKSGITGIGSSSPPTLGR